MPGVWLHCSLKALLSLHTKMMIINSPSNPSRNVIPVEDLAHTALAAQHCDAWLLSDEIYSRIVYDELDATAIYSIPGLVEGLKRAPRDIYQCPQDAFFCFPNIIAPGISSTNHHNWLLDEAGAA